MLGGEIKVVLSLDNNQFLVQTQKAGVTVQELQRAIDKTSRSTEALEHHFTGVMGKFRSVVQVASMLRYAMHDVSDIFAALPGAILKSSAEIEKLTKLMEGMSKETTKAAREAEALSGVKFVFNMAQRAPFDVKTLTDSFVKLKSGGLDPADGSMKALVDSVARFGGTSDTMHRASIAIQQMAGKGVISMEELRQQLGEAVPNAINMMAQGAGMSVAKFAKLVQTGTVEASTALRNMFLVMRFENDGAAESMMNTWTGMLALLKTKFEMFKIEAGKSQFFNEAKAQLQDMLGVFDGGAAKRVANDIGSGLADLVRTMRTVVDLMVEWSGIIKVAGQAFLLYFAANKVESFANAIKTGINSQIQKYKEDVQAKKDALANKATLIANEIADEQHQFASKQAAIDKQIAAEQQLGQKTAAEHIKTAERQRVALAKELADRVEHYQSLNRLQQQFLGQQMAAEMAAEAAKRQKKAGSAAVARGFTAEAGRIAGNATVNAGAIAATNAEIAAIKAKDAALLQSIQTTRNATIANNHLSESAAIAAQHARTMAQLNNQHAQAANNAAAGVGVLSRAMSGANIVISAFGGWVGIAIGVLVTLGQKLWDYMNRWEEFKRIVDRTKQGIASEDDFKAAGDRATEAAKSIKTLQTILAQLDKDGDASVRSESRARGAGFVNLKTGKVDVAAYRASLQKTLAEQQAIFQSAATQTSEQSKLLDEERSSRELSQFERTYRRTTEGKIDALRNEGAALAKAEREELDKARKGDASNAEEDAITKRYVAKRNALVIARERFLLETATQSGAKLDDMLSIEKDGKNRAILNAQKKFINEQIEQASTALKQAEQSLGTLPTTKKDPKAKLKEAPIVRMAEALEADVAAARAKLAATLRDAKDLQSIREQVMFEALGDMAEGKFDTMVGGKNGEKVPNRMGGTDARKSYVKELTAYLAKGNTDLTAFINGLDQLNGKDRTQFLEVFKAMVDKRQIGDAITALNSIKQIGVDTADELTRSTLEFTNNGLARENTYLEETQKRLDKLALTVTRNTEGYAEFIRLRDQSLGSAGQVDINKFGTEALKAQRESDGYVKKSILSQSELKRYEHQQELKRIAVLENRLEEATWNALQTGVIDQKAFQARMTEIANHADALRSASSKKLAVDLQTPIQKLAITWQDSTTAMQQATANWADDFATRLTNLISGSGFKWKEFVAGMAKDLLSMSIRKNFGGLITGMFGSFGSKMGEVLGLSGGADSKGSITNPMITKDIGTALGTDQFSEAKETLNSTWDLLNDRLSSVWDDMKNGIGQLLDGLDAALSSLMNSIASAFSSSTSRGSVGGIGGLIGSLFGGGEVAAGSEVMMAGDFAMVAANGGLMTEFGPASLTKYANGGIANSPQVSLFGEGSTPEAYVPLPDGRTIPVTMTGGNTTTQTGVVINIVVNKDGSQKDSTVGDEGRAWQAVAQKVRGVVMDEMVNQQRPGGLLYNR
jgi:tape measure domain-containing protein